MAAEQGGTACSLTLPPENIPAGAVKMKIFGAFALLLAASLGAQSAPASAEEEEKVLRIWNWSDYIAPYTIVNFEQETGIRITYDLYDSNEVLDEKVMKGNSGYDLVVPAQDFLARQIKAGAYRKLNRDNIPNWKNLDPSQMRLLEAVDPGNEHSIPYGIGTTGIGYNAGKFEEIFGKGAKPDSWDYFFRPENMKRLSGCGVAVLNSPTDIIAIALHYLGISTDAPGIGDLRKAEKLLQGVRPYIKYFHSSDYINDLAGGEICMAVGWSGDILQAAERAEDSASKMRIGYIIPKEGAMLFYDMMAIPADARHPRNAEKFMNYLLRPEIMASISSYVHYFNAVPESRRLVSSEVRDNPNIFLPDELLRKMFLMGPLPPEFSEKVGKIWEEIKSAKGTAE